MPLRKVSRCHQDLIEIIYKVADKLNFKNIEFVTGFDGEDIDSYLGALYRVKIKGIKDGQKITQVVIVKWHPEPNMRLCFRQSYHREYVFYERIVPALLEIQRRFELIEGLKIKFPNCIFASTEHDKETIVVLGLQKYGFRMLDRFNKTDFKHASLVMKNLAKLHALSFVLEKKEPREFENIKNLCYTDVQYSNPDLVSKSMKGYYSSSANVISDPIVKEKLQKLAPDISLVLNKCARAGPHSVICHADCWNNNILYKYQRSRPVDVVFVDYQFCRYASPVTDLSYFFYVSTEQDFLSKHYDHLLSIYYGTLTAVLRYCNLDVAEIYPKNVFERHLKEYSVLGLIEAMVSMKIITAGAEEAFKMTERKYGSAEGACENVTQNQSLYERRVNGVANDFFARNYSLNAVLNK